MYSTQPNHGVGPTAPSLRSSLHKYLAGQSSNSVWCVCVHVYVGGHRAGKCSGMRGPEDDNNRSTIVSSSPASPGV